MPDFLHHRLAALKTSGNHRELPGQPAGVDFWSNDYLGLAAREEAIRAGSPVRGKVEKRGAHPPHGATGSRSVSGDHPAYHALEARIAAHHGQPAALVFSSGYTANLGLLSALLRRTDTIVYDERMHASCRDGIRLGQAGTLRFRHNDPDDLCARLTKARPDGQTFVLTEGRFSMDGDLAPLTAIAETCQSAGAHLIVDEAHSGGLEGVRGAGRVAELGLQNAVFATVVTYGKAFGFHGAAVLGSAALREYLINTCRPFIYTTGPAPGQWTGIAAAYDRMDALHDARFALLQNRIGQFNDLIAAAGLRPLVTRADGPIQTVGRRGNQAVMAGEAACRAAGLLVKGIRSPTVKTGEERLRVCLHSFNTEEEVGRLVGVLASLGGTPPRSAPPRRRRP